MFLSLRTATLALILATVAIAIISLSAQAGDALAGTWELNLEKSTFNPGPPPQNLTRTYEVTGQQEKMVAKGIDAKGNPTLNQYTANRDGKDYPYEGWPLADTISLTPVDPFKTTYTFKKAEKVVMTGTRVISQDGKMMTLPIKFTTPNGQLVDSIWILDKR
jgi:hypothetical protein